MHKNNQHKDNNNYQYNNLQNHHNNCNDEFFMSEALIQAEIAWKTYNEVPIGAVIVKDNQIIATGFNSPINNLDPTAHAEIIAIRKASQILNNYRLINTTLYCTIEPCVMCFGAIIQARIKRIVFGAKDLKFGVLGSMINLEQYKWNHKFEITNGILEANCKLLMQYFFKQQRI